MNSEILELALLPKTKMNTIEVVQSEPGQEIIVRILDSRMGKDAWIGLFKTGSGDNEHGDRWKWIRDVDINHISLPAQNVGSWSVRLFKDDGYIRIASTDFQVKYPHSSVDQADAESDKGPAITAFVIGIIMFSMGLPLLLVGSISTGEDNLAMIIPGAILTGIGAFVVIVAAAMGMGFGKRATTSEQDMAKQGKGSGIEILEAVPGKPVRFRINNRPSSNDAWVGIYPANAGDHEHEDRWSWLRDIDVNNASLPGQAKGRWSIRVFSDGGYTLHDRVDFEITDDYKTEVWMQNVRIDDNRLKGLALEHPKHGTANVTTSPIVERNRQGDVNRFETYNTIYLVNDRDLQDEDVSGNSDREKINAELLMRAFQDQLQKKE